MNVTPWRHLLLGLLGPVALVALAAALAGLAGGGIERTLTVFFISLTAVAGIGLYSGNSGILSFGHLAFMGIAAYTSAILTLPAAMKQLTLPNLPAFLASTELSLLPSLILATLLTMLVALLVGLTIARLDGAAATIATLALLIIVHGVIIGARDFTRGSQSFFGVPRETDIWIAAAGCAFALVVARWFRDSVPGLKLRASREDAIAARASGIGVRGERLLAWVLSAGLVAIAGVLLGHYLGAFSPKKFYFVDTFALLAMLIVGGMTTVTGALLGAVIITVLSELLRRLEGGVELFGMTLPAVFGTTQIGVGLLILLVMWKRGEGLAGNDEWDERLLAKRKFLRSQRPIAGTGSELKNVSDIDKKDQNIGDSESELKAQNLQRHFSGLVAVDGVSIALRRGEIMGLIGPNGSGKTTLLNMLSGVLAPSAGHVQVDARGPLPVGLAASRFVALGIARTFQNIRLFRALTVRQNVLAAALYRWPRVGVDQAYAAADAALVWMEIDALAELKAGALSYGEQRRVEIARALALRPKYLLLDEPAAGMNREETDQLLTTLRELRDQLQLGLLIVDHDLPFIIDLCDRVVVLDQGKVISSGQPEQVQRDPAVITAYLGRGHDAVVPAADSQPATSP